MYKTEAVEGVTSLSRAFGEELAKDAESEGALAAKLAPTFSRSEVHDFLTRPRKMGTVLLYNRVQDTLAQATADINNFEPAALREFGIADTVLSRAAMLNPEVQLLAQHQPWKVAPAVTGLETYAQTVGRLLGDGHNAEDIAIQIAMRSLPADVGRMHNIMKSAETPQRGLAGVVNAAESDVHDLVSGLSDPRTIWRGPEPIYH
jgi:hypothetical protein